MTMKRYSEHTVAKRLVQFHFAIRNNCLSHRLNWFYSHLAGSDQKVRQSIVSGTGSVVHFCAMAQKCTTHVVRLSDGPNFGCHENVQTECTMTVGTPVLLSLRV